MPRDPLTPGAVLDSRYRIDALVGQGGMASVYRATDLTLRRAVAVKVADAGATGASTLTLFLNEAQALARVEHPGLVPVYAVGRAGELYYLAMKFIEGRTLSEVLKSVGRIAAEDVVGMVSEVCSALQALHAAGLVHRDVKPGNLMIGEDGKVTVMDLGIVQSADSSEVAATLGTPRYMAPEMLSNDEIDGRADVYSLGVIAYQALCGTVPFDGPTPMAILYMHAHESVEPLRDRAPDVPKAVAAVVMRALAKDPNERYQSAAAFAAAMQRAITPSRAGLWIAGAALLVAGGIAAALLWPEARVEALPDASPESSLIGRADASAPSEAPPTAPPSGAPSAPPTAPPTAPPSSPPTAPPTRPESVATQAPRTEAPAQLVAVKVLSSPLGATVKSGREVLGTTPLTLERPKGTRGFSVTISKPGYDPVSRRIGFTRDLTVRVTLKSGFDLVP